jgi:aminopeptidase YwaD
VGSGYFTQHPVFPLKAISFLLNMDIMGTGDEGITVVNGTVFKKEFDTLKEISDSGNLLKEVKIRGKAANSDHYHFSEKGVRAMFIYTMGGIKAYHDVYDKAETLPLTKFEELFQLITRFADYLQRDPK